jgi:hypothetical protein
MNSPWILMTSHPRFPYVSFAAPQNCEMIFGSHFAFAFVNRALALMDLAAKPMD